MSGSGLLVINSKKSLEPQGFLGNKRELEFLFKLESRSSRGMGSGTDWLKQQNFPEDMKVKLSALTIISCQRQGSGKEGVEP